MTGMRLFTYYVLHTFKNQLRKLFKTWVLIFLLICIVFGVVIGLFAAAVDDAQPEEPGPAEAVVEETSGLDGVDITPNELIELIAGGAILGVFLFMIFGADKNGSRIFSPADVNLLFASPMKPQSVLMFRVTTQLGAAVLGSLYLLIQVPNLTLNLGMSMWTALALILAWGLTIMLATLMQVLLYALISTYPGMRRYVRTGIYVLLALIAAGYLFTLQMGGQGLLRGAVDYFNADVSRWIPIWGWLKGFCIFAAEGRPAAAGACLAAVLATGGLMIYVIWNLRVDFYEDAMAKSEEVAAVLEKAQSEKSTGFLIVRKKERSGKLKRDGFRYGAGANVFFFKTLYNRFRFAHLGFFTKTMELYLAAAVVVGLFCRANAAAAGVVPLVLVLAVFTFFRSLGNPLEQDTMTDCFLMIPESTWKKLFWSLAGGSANCALDLLLPLLAGALIMGENPLSALLWLPFIVSFDFYATNVGAFIGFSVPVSAGKTIKQLVQVMFIYFGLLPAGMILTFGILADSTALAALLSAAVNLGLGLLFFGLSPLFLEPGNGRSKSAPVPFTGDLVKVRKQFSRLGLGTFTILTIATALQLCLSFALNRAYPAGDFPQWMIWVGTFAPLYIAAVPVGLLVIRGVPASPPEKQRLGAGKWTTAAIISIFMMYAGNIIGTIVTTLLQMLFGASSAAPILSYAMEGELWWKLLVMVILAPVIEEYIFRKQLIDRMNIYGQKLAVVTSALLFGLFHGNFSQFFYAFALGLVFGYVYLKTGRLRYSVGLHMLINFLGGVAAPAILNRVDYAALDAADAAGTGIMEALISSHMLPLLIYIALMLSLALAGLVLLCIKSRSIRFRTAAMELPRAGRLRTVFWNEGMLLLIVGCLALFALNMVG